MPAPIAIIIEDEPQIRRFVRAALEAEGWLVHEADNLKKGLTETGTRKPDLLVLDDPWEFPETTDAIRRAMARGGAVLAASSDPGGLSGLLGAGIHLVEGSPG